MSTENDPTNLAPGQRSAVARLTADPAGGIHTTRSSTTGLRVAHLAGMSAFAHINANAWTTISRAASAI